MKMTYQNKTLKMCGLFVIYFFQKIKDNIGLSFLYVRSYFYRLRFLNTYVFWIIILDTY